MIGLAVDIGTINSKIGFVGQSQPRLQTDSIHLTSQNQRTVNQYQEDFFTHQKQERLFGKDINIWRNDVNGHQIFEQHWQNQQKHLQLLNYNIKKQNYLQFLRALVLQMKQIKEKHNSINEEINQFSLLVIQPTYLKKYQVTKFRQYLSTFAFEQLHLSAIYFIKNSVCTTYSQGRTNAIVIDSGHNFTSISRVVDGFNQKSINFNFAGNIIGHQMEKYLHNKKLVEKTNFLVSKGRCQVFDQLCKIKELTSLKKCFRIDSNSDIQEEGNVDLQLADKTTIQIGRNELLEPFTQLQAYKATQTDLFFPEKYYSIARSVIQLLQQENGAHIDSIIMTGGNMLYNNLANRIADEIGRLLSNRNLQQRKIVKSNNPLTSSWIGSSIAGSSQSFPFYWCTLSQYREQGISIINKKCPL